MPQRAIKVDEDLIFWLKKIDSVPNRAIRKLADGRLPEVTPNPLFRSPQVTSSVDYDKIKTIVKDAVEDAIQELKAGRY